MQGVNYMLLVTNREFTEQYTAFFREHGIPEAFAEFANGTATASMLDCFGLEKTDKIMFSAMVRKENVPAIKKALYAQMNISSAGSGIAVFIPVDSIGGKTAKNQLLGEEPLLKGEEEPMEPTKTVLLVAVADKGHTETVMDAARSAGATGGTVVRGKGTGAAIAKFFGMSISEEKEMIYIVCKRTMRDDIMRAIMEKAGKDTDVHGIVFSLPVDSVCGIMSLQED